MTQEKKESIKKEFKGEVIESPIKAIRAKCLDCCCGSMTEANLCTACDCPLWPFRFGVNPYRKVTEMSEERKQEMARRMAAIRQNKS